MRTCIRVLMPLILVATCFTQIGCGGPSYTSYDLTVMESKDFSERSPKPPLDVHVVAYNPNNPQHTEKLKNLTHADYFRDVAQKSIKVFPSDPTKAAAEYQSFRKSQSESTLASAWVQLGGRNDDGKPSEESQWPPAGNGAYIIRSNHPVWKHWMRQNAKNLLVFVRFPDACEKRNSKPFADQMIDLDECKFEDDKITIIVKGNDLEVRRNAK